MAGRIVAKAVVEVDNPTSDTDDSGSYIEVEVDSDGNEIETTVTNNQQNGMTATVKTTSASVGVTREVAWPPKGNDNPKLNDGMGEIISSAAKKYVKTVESENQSKHGQYTLSRELFQPGKFKSDEIWNPTQQQQNYPQETVTKTQTPRRSFKSFDDVIQNNQNYGFNKQPSYHVPPGTTRTRKAQESYTKHLEVVTK